LQTQKTAPPPCQIPDSSGCFGIKKHDDFALSLYFMSTQTQELKTAKNLISWIKSLLGIPKQPEESGI
ncbi:MAG TPA: hypothetical protein VLE95_04935, partial [Chlamydiales bacterium]|nr:hypothetical protein [Chlamydiales bacterium]